MVDAYTLLGLEIDASDQQIRTAYRQTALRYHPDKCKDDPHANDRFAELVTAFELLKDPERRKELDAKIKAQRERAQRIKRQSAGRQAMIAKLERREREHEEREKRRKEEEMSESVKEKIQSELVRLREELRKQDEQRAVQPTSAAPPPPPDLSNTISVKISRKRKPVPDEQDLHDLFSRYGQVLDVVQSKKRRALVSFAEKGSAISASGDSERDYLDSMGLTASLYNSASSVLCSKEQPDQDFVNDSVMFPRGPPVSPIHDGYDLHLDDNMTLEDVENIVLRRMQTMVEKQQLKRSQIIAES